MDKLAVPRGLVVALVAAGILAAPASGGQLKAFSSDGDCEQAGGIVQVRAADVRPYVPMPFAIVGEATGTAQLFVTGGRCDNWVVDDRPPATLLFGLVAVVIERHGTSRSTTDLYDIWWFSNDSGWHSRLRALDFFSHRLDGIRFDVDRGPMGEAIAAHVSVPWSGSPFTVEAIVAAASPPEFETPSDHWYLGQHGEVHGRHDNRFFRASAVTAVVSAPPGSPLAEMMGAPSRLSPGLYGLFHASAETGLEAR